MNNFQSGSRPEAKDPKPGQKESLDLSQRAEPKQREKENDHNRKHTYTERETDRSKRSAQTERPEAKQIETKRNKPQQKTRTTKEITKENTDQHDSRERSARESQVDSLSSQERN